VSVHEAHGITFLVLDAEMRDDPESVIEMLESANEEEGTVFVTSDMRMVDGVLDATDELVLEQVRSGEHVELKAETLSELARGVQTNSASRHEREIRNLGPARVRLIRALRVEDGRTWRAVARACSTAWPEHREEGSNQIWGMQLCELAASAFDEDYLLPPWN
jgi:hypothetical protein